jgi:hypothetical protein
MLKSISAAILVLLSFSALFAQSTQTAEAAINPIQPSLPAAAVTSPEPVFYRGQNSRGNSD